MKKINVGPYTVALYKRQVAAPQDNGPTSVQVIMGENPPHWIIRLVRGKYNWDFKDLKSVIPPSNKDALEIGEYHCLGLVLKNGEHVEDAIYFLAGMRRTET